MDAGATASGAVTDTCIPEEEAFRRLEAALVDEWTAMEAEGRRLAHDPRRRQCNLASVTSLTFVDGRVAASGGAELADELEANGYEKYLTPANA